MTLSHLSLATIRPATDHRSGSERKARGVGVALGKCLRQALETGRLQCGILPSAALLQRCPERVLLCLLPVPQNNVCDHALHIHHTLISAFCAEHGIRCLRVHAADLRLSVGRWAGEGGAEGKESGGVDSVRHVASATSSSLPPAADAANPDVSCVLVKSPMEGLSFEDEVVLDYHDDVMSAEVFPKPVLNIPS